MKLCRLFRAVLLQEGGDLLLENLLKFRFGYKFVSGYPRFQTVDNFYRRCDSHIRRDQGVFQLIEGLCIHSVFTGDTFADLTQQALPAVLPSGGVLLRSASVTDLSPAPLASRRLIISIVVVTPTSDVIRASSS